jgi:hypothetical protein
MKHRDRLIELVEDGMLDPMMALQMCANWLSEDEVGEMLDANELSERFEEDEDDGQPDEAQEWESFDPDC